MIRCSSYYVLVIRYNSHYYLRAEAIVTINKSKQSLKQGKALVLEYLKMSSEDSLIKEIKCEPNTECPSYIELNLENHNTLPKCTFEGPIKTETENLIIKEEELIIKHEQKVPTNPFPANLNGLLNVVRPHFCDQCDYRSIYKSRIESHMKVHAPGGKKSLVCPQCDFKATTKVDLSKHMKIHFDDKPHACDQCSYRTKKLVTLRNHMRTHTGERPYPCDQCGYRARYKNNLRVHKSIHTEGKLYACEQCDYKTNHMQELKIHMTEHTGGKLYGCELCSYIAVTKGSITIHMNTCHM